MIKKYFIIFSFLFGGPILAGKPITPDKVFNQQEIDDIHETGNYFYIHDLDEKSPIWIHTKRKYGNHLLAARVNSLSMQDIVHHILSDGFPIKLRLQELYRAHLGIHSRIGDILPSLNIGLGTSITGVVSTAFSGLFNFLTPANWMNLANQHRVYKSTKYLLIKDVLDEALNAKLMYLTQHQNITDFEIMNYYFIHLQLLAQKYQGNDRDLKTLLAEFAVEGTDMASQRGNIKLSFDDLALIIALEKFGDDYSVNTFNIDELKDFPSIVKDLEDVPEIYKDKEKFLEKVIQRSVELKSVKELYEISQLNIGITATSGTINNITVPNNVSSFNMALRLGYGNLPNILIAKSLSKTAEINVRSNFLKMLDNARRSFDYYTNSIGGFTEATRSIELSRKALKEHIKYLVENNKEPDALFITAINQLIRAELKLNNALHGSLKARAYMNRFLLIDDINALKFLPDREHILKYFSDVKIEHDQATEKEKFIDTLLSEKLNNKKLSNILYNREFDDNLNDFSTEEINDAIKRNAPFLVKSKIKRHRKFYKTLLQYVGDEKIDLTSTEYLQLSKNSRSIFAKIAHKKDKNNVYETFKFSSFGDKESSEEDSEYPVISRISSAEKIVSEEELAGLKIVD